MASKASNSPNSPIGAVRRMAGLIGAGRLAITGVMVLLALLVARYAWSLPLAVDAERALYNLRTVVLMPFVDQDPRIVMVTFTDETLEKTGRRSPLDRGLLARALSRIDVLQPRSIGIDILIDQPQPEDAALQATLRDMQTPTYLAYGSAATNTESILPWQEAFERQFQSVFARSKVKPASIRLEADSDGVVRNWPIRPAGEPPILVERMFGAASPFEHYTRSIAFRLPQSDERPVFASLPIDLFDSDAQAIALESMIRGRHVLIGGDITDSDRVSTPVTRLTGRTMPGLELHATLLAQMLDGKIQQPVSAPLLWGFALLIVVVAAASGFADIGGWKGAVLLTSEIAALVAAPLGFERIGFDTQPLPAFGWLVGWTLAYMAAAAAARGVGAKQRRFAQSALGRYLPADVAREIMRDPERLTLTGERRTIYALFSDLEGFTALTHAIAPELVASLLNQYLDRLSGIVLAHGGTIDKFVGDSVVAFWGAPVARETDREMALRAAIAIAQAGDDFSAEAPKFIPTIGRTRVGVHRGEAIVGNFGGEDRIQYTALGDAMNTAARLEAANKVLKTRTLISAEAADGETDVKLRPMGRVQLRGRSTPVTVFEALPDQHPADVDQLAALLAAYDAGDPAALGALERLADASVEDAALANLVSRLKQSGPGGYYALV
jgi:adenylate cyclase